jgi:hypothetical protein
VGEVAIEIEMDGMSDVVEDERTCRGWRERAAG